LSDGVIAEVPLDVVTLTSTVVLLTPAGATAVIVVLFTTMTPVALFAPNFTVAGDVKLVPVIVTILPPAAGPQLGLTPVTVGGLQESITA